MYSRILVPMDGSTMSQQVIPYVRTVASALKSPVHLFRAFDSVPAYFYPDPTQYQARVQEAATSFRNEALSILDPIKDSLQGQGVDASVVLHEPAPPPRSGSSEGHLAGDPARFIIEEAEKDSNTLIVMCTHGRSGISRWVLGSVTDKVLHGATNPLLIVRGRPEGSAPSDGKLESLIVPLDGSALAEQILTHAINLSKALSLKISAVRVTPADRSDADARHHLRDVGERMEREGLPAFEEQVLHGDPAESIVELTEKLPDALVTMTTHGRSGVGRWVLGSVTDRVVRYAAGPVLVTRAA